MTETIIEKRLAEYVAEIAAQTTLVTATDMPSWRRVVMAVSVFFGSHGTQTSTLNCTVGMNETPQARVSLSMPHVMFNNDDDDNDDGTNDCDQVMFDFPENDIAKGYVTFASDEYTNGTIRVREFGCGLRPR